MIRAAIPAVVASLALVGAHLALGGGGYDVDRPPDPCTRPAPPARAGALPGVERVGLTALQGAACDLGVTRERLLLVIAGEVDPPPGLTEERRAEAFRAGLRRAVEEEERAGRLSRLEALALRVAIEVAPVEALLRRVFEGG